jgi:23S rRNA (pseudouridine1915-N3)-methyltransferase
MKIGVIAVGRLKSGPERELADRYAERFAQSGKALGLTGPALTELVESPARSAAERKSQEAQGILASAEPDALLIALDERGRTLSSDAFAAKIAQWRDVGRKSAVFVIGGADGLAESVRARSQETISFGQMTMPHQLVRVILLEQLYRAATILAGHPYHRS